MENLTERLRVFEAHGVVFTGQTGDQAFGTCPFTGKANKFYVNTKNLLWDSKTAGVSGNIPKFLVLVSDQYQAALTKPLLEALAKNRKLPANAFIGWEFGWDGEDYTLPVRDINGHVQDIRRYQLGQRMMSTPTCKTGLLGAHRLKTRQNEDVFVCEGEWDAIALTWLLCELGQSGVVVGVPGASVFKQEWRDWMVGRRVHTLYDADGPGEQGELLAKKRLDGHVSDITFVHWPDGVHEGFDVRDYIVYGAVENGTPDECWDALQRKFERRPRQTLVDTERRISPSNGNGNGQGPALARRETDKFQSNWVNTTPVFEDVVETFRNWLFLDDVNKVGIEATLATVISQEIDGPPVWLFLVAPPGGMKTETLSSLSLLPQVFMTSSLSPHALISGATFKGDQDPSLIPRLNGKIMVIKDFTSILAMRDMEKEEIFGILRDAYDGKCSKVFGTGVERSYESRFTLLAAVTPRIYDLSQQHQSLGERFLKCTVGHNLQHMDEQDIIRRAIQNVDKDSRMKWELQDVVAAFFRKKQRPKVLPALPEDMVTRLVWLGMFGARLRGTVTRDRFHHDIITSRPSAEIGTRLGVQLAKLAKAIALVHDREIVSEDDYRLVKKIMLDTINQRTEDIFRYIYLNCPTIDDTLTTNELAQKTRYPLPTVSRMLQDLDILDIVNKTGSGYRFYWTISEYMRECAQKAGLYNTDEEQTRPTRRWVKVRKGKAESK